MPTSQSGVLIGIPTALLPIQLPVKAPGKAAEDGPSTWASVMHVGDPEEGLAFGLAWLLGLTPGSATGQHHLGREPVDRRPLCVCVSPLSLWLGLSNK